MQTLLLSVTGAFMSVVLVFWLVERERKKNRFSPFTEKLLRSPGYTLSNQIQDVSDEFLMPFFTLGFIPFILIHFLKDANSETRIFTGVLFFIPIIWAIWKISKLFKEIRNLKLGHEGEVYTGQELNYLMRKGAWVYHDIPYKYGNIDHIIVSKAGIFTVETKAVRKPMKEDGRRDSNVYVENDDLIFPHFTTSEPIEQARRHTNYVKKYLLDKTGNDYPVFSIVAIPGWYVSNLNKDKKGLKVINPKRGAGIERYMSANRIAVKDLSRVVTEIEEFARSVQTNTDITDPDANKNYSFFLNRKPQEQKL